MLEKPKQQFYMLYHAICHNFLFLTQRAALNSSTTYNTTCATKVFARQELYQMLSPSLQEGFLIESWKPCLFCTSIIKLPMSKASSGFGCVLCFVLVPDCFFCGDYNAIGKQVSCDALLCHEVIIRKKSTQSKVIFWLTVCNYLRLDTMHKLYTLT